MSSFTVMTDSKQRRTYHMAKFRGPAPPALTDPAASVQMTQKEGDVKNESLWVMDVGDAKYDGTRERVAGTSGSNGYALFRVDANGVLSVLPLTEWYDFRLHIEQRKLSKEEQDAKEKEMERKMGGGNDTERKPKKKSGADADGDDDDGDENAAGVDEFDFDDGADPRFKEDVNEDGREGLDMEGEDDMFDDDENDQEAEDDEHAMEGREQAKAWGPGEGTLAGADAAVEDAEDDGEEAAVIGSKEMKDATKQALREDKKARRDDDDDFDDDDDDDDEGEAALKKLLDAEVDPEEDADDAASDAAGSSTDGAPATAPAPAPAPAGKRRASPVPPEGEATGNKKARTEPPRKGKVEEKEVVMVIHEHGKLQLKELVAQFRPLLPTKADRDEFMQLVKKVAKLTTDHGQKFVVLNEITLEEYKLAK